MKYKVLDVINRESNETSDKFQAIGKQVTTPEIIPNTRAHLIFMDQAGSLLTSMVQEVEEDRGNIRVTTMNTVYVLEHVNEEEAAE